MSNHPVKALNRAQRLEQKEAELAQKDAELAKRFERLDQQFTALDNYAKGLDKKIQGIVSQDQVEKRRQVEQAVSFAVAVYPTFVEHNSEVSIEDLADDILAYIEEKSRIEVDEKVEEKEVVS